MNDEEFASELRLLLDNYLADCGGDAKHVFKVLCEVLHNFTWLW
jgi:hypothetical protein